MANRGRPLPCPDENRVAQGVKLKNRRHHGFSRGVTNTNPNSLMISMKVLQ